MKRVLLSLTVASLIATSLQARGGHHSQRGGELKVQTSQTSSVEVKRGYHRHGIMKYLFQLTDLTDEQSEAILVAFSDERTAMQTIHEERVASGTISTLISESGLDREAFLTQEAELHSQMAELKANTLETILATLTPEQITELNSLIEAEVVVADETESSTTSETTE